MSCVYQVWDQTAEPPSLSFGNFGEMTAPVVGPGNLVKCGQGDEYTHLCAEHAGFVADAEEKGVMMHDAAGNTVLVHPKAIKELFPKQKKKRKPRICPHCGKQIGG